MYISCYIFKNIRLVKKEKSLIRNNNNIDCILSKYIFKHTYLHVMHYLNKSLELINIINFKKNGIEWA